MYLIWWRRTKKERGGERKRIIGEKSEKTRKNREEERREKWKTKHTHQRGRGRLHHKKQERKKHKKRVQKNGELKTGKKKCALACRLVYSLSNVLRRTYLIYFFPCVPAAPPLLAARPLEAPVAPLSLFPALYLMWTSDFFCSKKHSTHRTSS